MKWQAQKDNRIVEAPVEALATVAAAPFLFVAIGIFLLEELKRERFGPSVIWQPWYAWHPVRVTNHAIDTTPQVTVWLERIWRRRHLDGVEYATVPPPSLP